jgi:hypothetical protein
MKGTEEEIKGDKQRSINQSPIGLVPVMVGMVCGCTCPSHLSVAQLEPDTMRGVVV